MFTGVAAPLPAAADPRSLLEISLPRLLCVPPAAALMGSQASCSRLASPGLEQLGLCSSLVLGITSYHSLYCQKYFWESSEVLIRKCS